MEENVDSNKEINSKENEPFNKDQINYDSSKDSSTLIFSFEARLNISFGISFSIEEIIADIQSSTETI